MKKIILLLIPLLLISCKNKKDKEIKFNDLSSKEILAQFPADLGENTIDLSKYPEQIKIDYKVFAEKCSRCHTLARTLNSPFRNKSDWTRYVYRMHKKSYEILKGPLLQGKEAQQVIRFLTYDAKERKLKHAQKDLKKQIKMEEKFQKIKDLRQKKAEERATK